MAKHFLAALLGTALLSGPAMAATSVTYSSLTIGAPAQTEVDDADPSVIYSLGNSSVTPSGWTPSSNPADYDSTEHYSDQQRSGGPTFQGASAAFNVNIGNGGGGTVTWFGKKAPNLGIAAVSVDGGTPVSVDQYVSGAEQDDQPLWTSGQLAAGPHVIQVALTASKNVASTDYYAIIDAFGVINGSALPPSSGTVIPAAGSGGAVTNPALTYSSGWTCGANADDLSGAHCWNNTAGATVSGSFSGQLFEIYGRPDEEDGPMSVSIDGGSPVTINTVYGTVDDDSLNAVMLAAFPVAAGSHTFVITNVGPGYTQIDELMAFGSGGSPALNLTITPNPASEACAATVGSQVATLSVTGGDGNPVTYSVTGGDTADFAISGSNVVVGPNGIASGNCGGAQTLSLQASQP